MNNLYPVYTLKQECHDCYKCIRECHVKAIKIENGSASVLNDKCIACGHCVIACPSGAKRVRNDIDKVKTLLTAQKKIYVSLAPSWAGVYELSIQQMVAILKKLGFYAISETALGAQEVSIKCAQILNNGANGLYISSACPVIVDYIKYYKPEFTENITPIASPALTHAKILKETYGNEIAVVFIGPCIGKKNESDRHPDLIDAALTFEELNLWINDEFININELEINEQDKFIPDFAYEGALYPIEGGMNETMKQIGLNKDITLINVSSLPSFEKALTGLEKNNLNKKIFVEALACDGGCINGPCIASTKASIAVTADILSKIKYRENIPKEPKVVVDIPYKANPVNKEEFSLEELTEAMKKIGKTTEADELNCGGCGYSTCRDLAQALIRGEAEPSMCISYMRKTAMKKAAKMLRCMPSAVVMVDKNLNILEANDAFMRTFCADMYEIFASRPEGVTGAAIERLTPFADIFKNTLKTGQDIHKEHFPHENKLYDINAFTIESGEIAGAVITDVTKSEMDREKIARRAREVISKNIATVQDIACLLGEHMVETELLLSSIAEDFETTQEKEGE